MQDEGARQADAKARRASANRSAYLTERDRKDRVLLRLDKGAAAKLDQARASSGLSRSAFLMEHVEALRSEPTSAAGPPAVGDEFDRLFGER